MSETERPDLAKELSLSADALERDDLDHALVHLGMALRLAPTSAQAHALLNQVAAAAPDGGLSLLPGQPSSVEEMAVRACLLARRGEPTAALRLVLSLVLLLPEAPFPLLASDWLARPGAASAVDPQVLADFCVTWLRANPDGKLQDPLVRLAHEPLIGVFQAVLASHAGHATAHWLASAVARRLGRGDLAVAWARHALAVAPGHQAATMLAYALRDEGRVAEAEAAFRDAIRLGPDEPLIRVDLAELLCDAGRPEEGLAELDQVLRGDPEHERALPVALWRRWQVDHDRDHVRALLDYLDRHPDRRFGHHLVGEMAGPYPWVCHLPEPADATVNLLRRLVAEQQPEEPSVQGALQIEELRLSHLESPSALVTLALMTGTSLGERVEVDAIQEPDPRMPRRPIRHQLWRYQGKLPQPAIPMPAPRAIEAAAALAAGRHFAPWYRLDRARALAQAVGQAPVAELLGLMVHPPAPPAELAPAAWNWIRRVQTLAALAVAQLDDGWQHSIRREVLLDVADGSEDWTVEAAQCALAWIASSSADAQAEIAHWFAERLVWLAEHAAAGHHTILSGTTTCQLALTLPDLGSAFTDLAGKLLEQE